jgi:tetratricopeptide (TPR) repeat protein
MEPDNPEWLMEKSYAHSNLGALIIERGGGDSEAALSHINSAVELNKQVIEMDPDNPVYQSELGTALAWLADSQLSACDLGGALITRQESVAVAKKQLEESPVNANLKVDYAGALSGVANVASQVGLTEMALENYELAMEIFRQLYIVEPSNIDTRFSYLMRKAWIAELLAGSGHMEEALRQMAEIRDPMLEVLEKESYGNLRRNSDWLQFLLMGSDMKWRAGLKDEAEALMSEAVDHLEKLLASDNEQASYLLQILDTRYLYWQQRGEDLVEAPAFSGIEVRSDSKDRSCQTQAGLVRQAILEGDRQMAQELTTELLAKGYYEQRFIRTCREFKMCE